ncbi:MAG: alpha/beta hydrolase [Oscillospiraceae bacterium]|nr:alpha/beta hydrolase [Oscillospiraceae bacterium]MBQ9694960.1 alpha/beta hydrolase [Oscillospiraceae bacterium]
MKITEFGTQHDRTFLLLPGTSCTWECNFDLLLKPLAEQYHVLCVNYTGFDGTAAVFDTQTAETERIEQYVGQHFGGQLDAVYGSSMGGSFASLLVQRRRIRIGHVFIGSSDLDQASPLTAKLATAAVSLFMKRLAKHPEKALQKFARMGEAKGMGMSEQDFRSSGVSEDYMQHMVKGFCATLQSVDSKSVKNQFYSDLVTRLEDRIDVPGTVIHVFHSTKMGEKYLKRYRQHYANPDIIPLDYGHEGWLGDPELMMEIFRRNMGP